MKEDKKKIELEVFDELMEVYVSKCDIRAPLHNFRYKTIDNTDLLTISL